MSHDRRTGAKRNDPRPERSPEHVEKRLEDALARVREDARTRPDAYARDTEVPAGGE